MVFLPTPFTSNSLEAWVTIESGPVSFRVQARSTAGDVKVDPLGPRLVPAAVDRQPYRIIYHTSSESADASPAPRSVVAVGTSRDAILEDWHSLTHAWGEVYRAEQGAAVGGTPRPPAPRTLLLSEKDWKPVFVYLQATAEKGGRAGESEGRHHDGARATAGPSNGVGGISKGPRGVSPSTQAAGADTAEVYFDVYDTLVLQLCDLWAWRYPQLTATTIALIALGGLVPDALAELTSRALVAPADVLLTWPAVLCVLLCVALPVGHTQTQRRRVLTTEDMRPDAAVGKRATRHRWEAAWMEHQVKADTHRLALFNRTMATLTGWRGRRRRETAAGVAPSPTTKTSSCNSCQARVRQLAATPLGATLGLLGLAQAFLSRWAPAYSPGAVLDLFVAPLVVGTLLLSGAYQLWTTAAAGASGGQSRKRRSSTSPARPTAPQPTAASGLVPTTAAVAPPSATTPATSPPRPAESRAERTPASPRAIAGGDAGKPPRSGAASPTAAVKPSSTPAGLTYRLPALTDKESAVVEQLSNYGAAFSMVLVRPLREWNQTTGWATQWERHGVRCEARKEGGRPGTVEMRATVNIPHSNVGALEAVLLDDPDFLDAKGTFAYQYNPLLAQRCVVKRLAYNLLIVLTRHRSPVFGVPPLEILQYVSPAILLDPEQQEALGLRRPFLPTTATVDGEDAGGASGSKRLMAFVQCALPCPPELHPTPPCQPPHVRGVTSMSFIVGMEEADGSLTVGAYECLNSRGIIPSEWEGVYRALLLRRASNLANLLGQEGPKPNQLAVYENRRDFQPFLDRQAASEPLSQPQPSRRRSRAAGDVRQDGQLYSSGSALLTSELELAMPSPVRRHTPTPSGGGWGGELGSCGQLTPGPAPTLPRLPQRFVRELLTLDGWAPESSKGPVRAWSCQTPFSDRRAMRTMIFVPRVELVLVEELLHSERFTTTFHPLVERQVTVTRANLPSLLANAVVGGGDGEKARDGATPAPPAEPLPTPDFQRDTYHGCAIHYTTLRSPMWGVAPRDTVTRVAVPYYFTAADARSTLFTPEQLAALPGELRELPSDAALFLYCGEDASDVLPPMKQYQRGKVILFGYLCWESTAGLHHGSGAGSYHQRSQSNGEVSADTPGVTIMCVMVMEPGGRLRGKLSDKLILDQQRVALKMREAMCAFREESQEAP